MAFGISLESHGIFEMPYVVKKTLSATSTPLSLSHGLSPVPAPSLKDPKRPTHGHSKSPIA